MARDVTLNRHWQKNVQGWRSGAPNYRGTGGWLGYKVGMGVLCLRRDIGVEIANLILEYLKVLAWPAIVVVLSMMFREPISELLRKIKKIGFAGGILDAEADEASSAVDAATVSRSVRQRSIEEASPDQNEDAETSTGDSSNQPSSAPKGTETSGSPGNHEPDLGEREVERPEEVVREASANNTNEVIDLMEALKKSLDQKRKSGEDRAEQQLLAEMGERLFYEQVRQRAVGSPDEAVREAYQRVRLIAQSMLKKRKPDTALTGKMSLGGLVEQLGAAAGPLSSDAVDPAWRLTNIYGAARKGEQLSISGALSFIDAAQKLEGLFDASEAAMRRRREAFDITSKNLLRLAKVLELPTKLTTRWNEQTIVVQVTRKPDDSTFDQRMQRFQTAAMDIAVSAGLLIRVSQSS